MANANGTLSRAKSKPELFALFLFKTAANWRLLLAFLLVVALTVISITFNIQLGKMSGADTFSEYLLMGGYALLDMSALFLSGFIGMVAVSLFRRIFAFLWFGLLVALSLWAAASFTIANDVQTQNQDLAHSIDQKQTELYAINSNVEAWQQNVRSTTTYKTKYQKTLDEITNRQLMASDELHALEMNLPKPTMAIYNMTAPLLGTTPETLQTVVKLLWAGALTLSPLVIMLLISTGKANSSADKDKPEPTPPKNKRRRWWANLSGSIASKLTPQKTHTLQPMSERQTEKQKTAGLSYNSATQKDSTFLVDPVRGHNGATPTQDLNGLKYVREWLKNQEAGRVTRHKVGLVSKLKSRDAVTNIINALIDEGRLARVGNGQLIKPVQGLRLVK